MNQQEILKQIISIEKMNHYVNCEDFKNKKEPENHLTIEVLCIDSNKQLEKLVDLKFEGVFEYYFAIDEDIDFDTFVTDITVDIKEAEKKKGKNVIIFKSITGHIRINYTTLLIRQLSSKKIKLNRE